MSDYLLKVAMDESVDSQDRSLAVVALGQRKNLPQLETLKSSLFDGDKALMDPVIRACVLDSLIEAQHPTIVEDLSTLVKRDSQDSLLAVRLLGRLVKETGSKRNAAIRELMADKNAASPKVAKEIETVLANAKVEGKQTAPSKGR